MTTGNLQQQNGLPPVPGKNYILNQFLWLIIWPLITVLVVTGVVYLDRMHTFRGQAINQEKIRLETLQLLIRDRTRTVASDLKILGNNQILQSFIDDQSGAAASQAVNLLDNLLQEKEYYLSLRLLSLDGAELIERVGKTGYSPVDEGVRSLEKPYVFEAMRRGSPENIYQFLPQKLTAENDHDTGTLNSIQRFYHVATDKRGNPLSIVTLDYDVTAIFRSLQDTEDHQLHCIMLLDQAGNIWGMSRGSLELSLAERLTEADQKRGRQITDVYVRPDFLPAADRQQTGHLYRDGSLYVFRSMAQLSAVTTDVHIDIQSGSARLHETGEADHYRLIAEVSSTYFLAQRNYYLKQLLLLGLMLLVPSVFVCLFLANSRARVKEQAALRYREHSEHLEQLEAKVRKRTRELYDSNLKLSEEVSERLNAERQLRLNNELLSGMIESIDGIIYVADFDSHEILFANEYLKRLFGFDPVGRLCWQFLHSNQGGPCSFCTNSKLLDENGTPTPFIQWEYQNPFNKKWYVAKDQAIMWSNGKYVRLEIAIDITEQKRLQYFLQEARKQAELAIGARSRFVALVAHDLRSPFYSITRMLKRILERETFTYRVHRQFLENIVENGHRMLQMIDNLLSMERFETDEVKLDKSFFDVSVMADEVILNFKNQALEKELRLMNKIPAETMIYADRYLYYVVLNNLLSNAVKFSGQHGRIVLSRAEEIGPTVIAVADNGPGMSPEFVQNLFKEDVKTSSPGTMGEKGSGLGLIFCQEIIRAHHGMIHIESQRGAGSRFFIKIPPCSPIKTAQKDETRKQ